MLECYVSCFVNVIKKFEYAKFYNFYVGYYKNLSQLNCYIEMFECTV